MHKSITCSLLAATLVASTAALAQAWPAKPQSDRVLTWHLENRSASKRIAPSGALVLYRGRCGIRQGVQKGKLAPQTGRLRASYSPMTH